MGHIAPAPRKSEIRNQHPEMNIKEMKMKKLFLTALCLVLATAAMADVKIVQKVKTGPMMGQPAKDTTVTMYIKGHKARNETGTAKQYQIIDVDSGKVYVVDPDKKQAMVMTTEMMKQSVGMISQMMGGAKPTVEKPGTTHTYNGFKCEDVRITITGSQMMGFTSVSCVSSSLDVKEFEPFKDFSQDVAKIFGVESKSSVPGFPVHTETKMKMMGQDIDSTTELVSISHDSVDASLFEIPPDYKIQEMNMPPQKKP